MSQHIGIVGVSAEGTALCYRTICVEAAESMGAHTHPEITLHAYPLNEYAGLIEKHDWVKLADMMLESARKLAEAGADFLICPDNTVHQAFDQFVDRAPLPVLHIAEVVAEAASARGYSRVGVLGTRYLMEGPVYTQKLEDCGVEHRIPDKADRDKINAAIFSELVYGKLEDSTRKLFSSVIDKLGKQGCEAVVLGSTEIPLLISDADASLPTLDSTRLLARAALARAIHS